MTWADITQQVIAERGQECEKCAVSGPLDPPHHGVIWRLKGANKILNVKYNLLLLCQKCHKWFHDNKHEGIRLAWSMLVERYGYKVMCDWLAGLDLKIKPRLEWLEDVLKW